MVFPKTSGIYINSMDDIKPGNFLKCSDAWEFATTATCDCARAIYNLDVLIWDDDLYGYLVPKYEKIKHLMWVHGFTNSEEFLYDFGKKPNIKDCRNPTFGEFVLINEILWFNFYYNTYQ